MAYEIEPHEVRALLTNLLGGVLAETDDLIRYEQLTREQALYDALVSAIKQERGRALAALAEGRSKSQVAEIAGLGTRQRVEQLIAAGSVRA